MPQPKKTAKKTTAKSKIAASTTIQNKPTLQAIKKEVGGRTYSKPLLAKLGKEGVKTLVDIRQKGGLGELEGLTEKQQTAAQKLEAHAYLNLISEDIALNEKLIDAGFEDASAIAHLGVRKFTKKIKDTGISAEQAAEVHAKATAVDAYLTHAITAARTEITNNYSNPSALARALEEEYPPECEVKECNSAVSPLAYLTELLVYTLGHVEEVDTIEDLEDRFFQPFARFTNACEEVDRKVRQVRIAVEVLRKYLAAQSIRADIQAYLFQAYQAILRQLGTSYDELRRMKAADPKKRKALANRLGINIRESRPDALDELLFPRESITEEKLERLFGLIDTTRDPLCDGLKWEPGDQKIESWHFYGVDWNVNTSPEGNIYAKVEPWQEGETHKEGGTLFRLFRSPDYLASALVAEGRREEWVQESGQPRMVHEINDPLWLEEKNESGLTASIKYPSSYNGLQKELHFSVISGFLGNRLNHLRTLWREQDKWGDAFFKRELPVIDPDLIGPEDLRDPEAGNPVFDLWLKRRTWIDQCLTGMLESHGDGMGGNLSDEVIFTQKLQRLSGQVDVYTYKKDNTQVMVRDIPWSEAVTLEEIRTRQRKLRSGSQSEIEEQKAWISSHALTDTGFSRLAELIQKTSSAEVLLWEEWREVDAILVQVQKMILYPYWVDEELNTPFGETGQKRGIHLDSVHFWRSLSNPEEGIWGPALKDLRPLIDPQIISQEELNASSVGSTARHFWEQRFGTLADISNTIADAYDTGGQLESALESALGSVPPPHLPGTKWTDIIDPINTDLESLDEAVRLAAQEKIDQLFTMSVEDFQHIVMIKKKEESGSEEGPSTEELDKLFSILTTAYKKRNLYDAWREEEASEDLHYWKVLKTRLPLWRSSIEARFYWQRALKEHSETPAVDPDIVREMDLKHPFPGDVAYTVYQERVDWLSAATEALREKREEKDYHHWGSRGATNGKFASPGGIAVNGEGNVYVADTGNHRIQVFDPAGRFVKKWGSQGGSNRQFKNPVGIAIDPSGQLFVADQLNHRIQVFNETGGFIRKWGTEGEQDGQFKFPTGVGIHPNGQIYVVERDNHRIQVFDADGNFIRKWGEEGVSDGQFKSPFKIAIDHNGEVYVADKDNHRIQVFDADGNFIRKWGTEGEADGQFRFPMGIGVDEKGNIYVVDSNNHRVQVFDAEGNFIRKWGRQGNGDRMFDHPWAIACDQSDKLYVADWGNNRIQKFSLSRGLDDIVQDTLGISLNELMRLAKEHREGTDITKRLEQLHLPVRAFLFLTQIGDILHSGAEVMPEEWQEVYAVLTQVLKRLECAHWNREEQEKGLLLSPDFFTKEEERWKLEDEWRSDWETRWNWEDKLNARIDQEKNTYAAMAEAVDKAEEATIAQLRDILLQAVPGNGSLSNQAKMLTEKLLIDFENSPCRKTTRISQAITTLQKFLFLLRSEQYDDDYELVDEHFDQKWKWLGSYETWKAAVGIFLYPENVLLPGLKKNKTRIFEDLLVSIRKFGDRLAYKDFNLIVKDFESYFKDIFSLSPKALIQLPLDAIELQEDSPRTFIIAEGSFSKSLFFSFYNIGRRNYQDWIKIKIPGLGNRAIREVIGVSYYDKYIYLFIRTREDEKEEIAFSKFNLMLNAWEEFIPLKLPLVNSNNYKGFSAKLIHGIINEKPKLAIISRAVPNSTVYIRKIVDDDWEEGDWEDFLVYSFQLYPPQEIIKIEPNYYVFLYPTMSGNWELKLYAAEINGFKLEKTSNTDSIKSTFLNGVLCFPSKFFPIWEHSEDEVEEKKYIKISFDEEITFSEEKTFLFPFSGKLFSYSYSENSQNQFLESIFIQEETNSSKLNRSTIELDSEDELSVKFMYSIAASYPSITENYELNASYFLQNSRYNSRVLLSESGIPKYLKEFVWEAFYYVPLSIAIEFQRIGKYEEALRWYKTVYDYNNSEEDRKIFYGLIAEEPDPENPVLHFNIGESINFLDPTDIHAIAREWHNNAYTRYVLLSVIRCLLAFADAEFTRDTVESLMKASLLYEKICRLLKSSVLQQYSDNCKELSKQIGANISLIGVEGAGKYILRNIINSNRDKKLLVNILDKTQSITKKESPRRRQKEFEQFVREVVSKKHRPKDVSKIIRRRKIKRKTIEKKVWQEKSRKGISKSASQPSPLFGLPTEIKSKEIRSNFYLPQIGTYGEFGIPWNPFIRLLQFHAENNLKKLRNCRNIAGVKRVVEAYAATIDIESAMPVIGSGGQLILQTSILPPPVPYRYEFLIEHAKQLINIATQMEAALLSALEKKEQELYNQLNARQDLQMARAGLRLQNLRLRQAKDEVELAELQRQSGEIQFNFYESWINEGKTALEETIAGIYITNASAFAFAAAGAIVATQYAAAAEYTIQAESFLLKTLEFYASQERREQEWQLQRDLATNAIAIGDQQIRIAEDGVDIVEQEVKISKIKVDHTQDIVEFLQNKETNFELYDWMQSILEETYSYFLQQATAMAKLAQNQLAFERQESPPAFIQHDYWVVPSENSIGGATEDATDRHGLTGSARLLADIYRLDQYRLESEKKKLQLTKNISLASVAPFEFQKFRETGVLTFQTLMEWFDRDFPGHYLRMIKRVRTSVIALVPPVDGIKATLTNIGVSRIVTDRNGLYQTIIAHRPPESVALTSPTNATGLFELEAQNSSMMLPFEGLGVDTTWEFRMPKAANAFDYNTIADIILTIEYTALDIWDYRQEVIGSLRTQRSGDRPYSFRHQFADAWYDLHNSEQSETPMLVSFRTTRSDFPPNLENVKIQQVLLYFASEETIINEMEVELTFQADEGEGVALGGEAVPIDGVISTRRGNGSAWTIISGQPVVGTWTLTLPNTFEVKALFEEEKIEDILLVITFSGRTPDWPE